MAAMTMLKQKEMFALKESSFPKGDNFSKFLGILMCLPVVGIRASGLGSSHGRFMQQKLEGPQ